MSDLISRQAAIEALRECQTYLFDECDPDKKIELRSAERAIEDLPSAQLLVLTCDGCRHVGTYDTDFPCSGCIRREKDYYEQER